MCSFSCLKKSPPVSKRAATSLVLSKPLPAFSLSYPYKVVFRFQPEHILFRTFKIKPISNRPELLVLGVKLCELKKNVFVFRGWRMGSTQENSFQWCAFILCRPLTARRKAGSEGGDVLTFPRAVVDHRSVVSFTETQNGVKRWSFTTLWSYI